MADLHTPVLESASCQSSLEILPRLSTVLLVMPKLDVSINTESPSFDQISFLLHEIFDCKSLVGKNTQMITNDMTILATRT